VDRKNGEKMKNKKQAVSFEQIIREQNGSQVGASAHEPLAVMKYEDELELKNKAFAEFLRKSGISLKPKALVGSPKPRNYRTTTKRRVFCDRHGIGLGFSQEVKPGVCAESALEPEEHQKIYQWLLNILSEKSYSGLARALNWIIIRGDYRRQFLILNVYKMDSSVVRKLKQLTALLQKENIVVGAMSYYDPTRSEYYLEADKAPRELQVKHLFGQKLLGLKVGDILMRYSPTGFSQVNESMVPEMVDHARQLLNPQSSDQLLDLYCGYGLFSHTMGGSCKKVTGVELSKDSINSAKEISKRLKTRSSMNFFAAKIDASLVRDKVENTNGGELILLDPPRKGCEPGVIAQLAKRKPKRVLHIFCGTDEVPREIHEWEDAGYSAKVIQPIDMFAGTPNLETMILFEKR